MKSLFIILFSFNLWANDFYTTRLMSTAGAGVGAILLNESAILNPSTISFFKNSSVYYQKYDAKLQDANNQRSTDNLNYPHAKNGHLFIVTDTSSQNHGSLSYMTYNDVEFTRKRLGISFARPINRDSSFGMIYRRTKDYMHNGGELEYNQVVFGISHIVNERFSFGTILTDPFKSKAKESKVILGTQFIISQHLYFLLDVGGYYIDSLSENSEIRSAVQIRFLSDLYIRFGIFTDKFRGIKGDGWGISWNGPKLSLDFAVINSSDIDEQKNYLYTDEQLVETSFTVSVTI